MAKTISIEPGTLTNYLGTTALSDDTVYLRSDNYAIKLAIDIPARLSSLSASVGFRANAGVATGKGKFNAGLTQTNGSSPPAYDTIFYFTSDSDRKGSFTINKKLKSGRWYLWVWKNYDGGSADILSGRKSQGYPTWSITGVTDPAGHVYRDGGWKDAVPKVYRNGAWKDATAREYEGNWGELG